VERPMVRGGIPPVDFETLASLVMVPVLTSMPSHIRRVWVFERYRNSVMWCHPSVPERFETCPQIRRLGL
jgi:hypothetical protein